MLPPVLRDLACAGWLRKKTAAPTRPSTIVATASTVLSIGAGAALRASKKVGVALPADDAAVESPV